MYSQRAESFAQALDPSRLLNPPHQENTMKLVRTAVALSLSLALSAGALTPFAGVSRHVGAGTLRGVATDSAAAPRVRHRP
jgi:hypothetical protein